MQAVARSHFCALPLNVLEGVAEDLASFDPLNSPRDLLSLSSTCRYLYGALSVTHNVHLYARIFCAQFDCRAARHRLPRNALYSAGLAYQYVAYSIALNNIRRGNIDSPTLLHDLWRAFTLCLENDGKNAVHLEHVGLHDYVESYIYNYLWEERSSGWPTEDITNSLALWLYWYTLSEERLATKTAEERAVLMALFRPYALYSFRYPPFLAPDNHARLPLSGNPDMYREHSTVTPHGYYPVYRDPDLCQHHLLHYGSSITFVEPPIGLVAKLLYITFQEHHCPVEIDQPVPEDRDEAIRLGERGPTRAEFLEFALHRAVKFPLRVDWDWQDRLPQDNRARENSRSQHRNLKYDSTAHDDDWERWRGCYNPWARSPSRGVPYIYGSLTGSWGGRSLDPRGDEYEHAIRASEFDEVLSTPETPHINEHPLFFTLREHYCISPATPLPFTAAKPDPLDEGIMNAYLPHGFPQAYAMTQRDGKLVMRHGKESWVYETYVEGKENSHNEDTCRMCAEVRWRDEQERLEDGVSLEDEEMTDDNSGDSEDMELSPQQARELARDTIGMDVDEFIDHVEREVDNDSTTANEVTRVCTGISDIIITGLTPRQHALSWGDYRIYGRVRAWDGLVVLLRLPAPSPDFVSPFPSRLQPYVFRGYLVAGKNFVGSWRHLTDSIHTVPIEGPFAVSKIETPPSPAASAQSQHPTASTAGPVEGEA
ncbi:hypothetical protein GY45DRAFT_1374008 [Cubamyces sp. BRFM 1775]|nr:hypothetical protein GY45DRAFT_1374008 [Cubamyces sp. BRFM 1775]